MTEQTQAVLERVTAIGILMLDYDATSKSSVEAALDYFYIKDRLREIAERLKTVLQCKGRA